MRPYTFLWTLVLLGTPAPSVAQHFHTSPACWEAPRRFHAGPVGEDLQVRITLDRVEGSLLEEEATLSPNKAYAFHLKRPDTTQPPPWQAEVLVFIERDYLVRLRFTDVHQLGKVAWINEKLLFVNVWWGRIAGTDFILDIEREAILYEEMFEWGATAFEQFKQCQQEEWKDHDLCQCPWRN